MQQPGADSDVDIVVLFSDIEGSTQLWEEFPHQMGDALAMHDSIITRVVSDSNGHVVKSTGDGMMAILPSVRSAVTASIAILESLESAKWEGIPGLKVRIGVHAGPAQRRGADYFGQTLNRAARLMSAGHGQQILVSQKVADELADGLGEGISLSDMGAHRLRDLTEPQRIYQVVAPGLPEEFPPLVTLDAAPNNLPTLASSFLGRERELEEIRGLLRDGARVVTLLGPGGTGKTRLALQAAADRTPYFRHGVFFVDLSTETEPEESYATIARVVGIDPAGDQSALDTLVQGLADRQMLLILDNLEQIAGVGMGIVALTAKSPDMSILTTSRRPLRIAGEHLYQVNPLSLPPLEAGIAEVLGSEAGALFVDRARAATPEFGASDETAPDIAALTRRLDGLPLALELAASRLRVFSIRELKERLDQRLDVLGTGTQDLPERQRTLYSTIAWSFELLEAGEASLLELMTVFSDTSLDDLESVAIKAGHPGVVIDQISSLIDRSLVTTDRAFETTRYGLLQTIRDYTSTRLNADSERQTAFRSAHAEHFTERALSSVSSVGELKPDIENLQLAWDHWMKADDLDRLHDLLDPLWRFYDSEGWYQGAMALAEDMLDVLETQPETLERTKEQIALQASIARARLLIRGYTEESERAFRETLAAAEASGEVPRLFPILRSLASFYVLAGRLTESVAIGSDLLEIAETEPDNPDLMVDAALVYGANTAFLDEMEEGMEYLDRAIESFDPSRMHSDRFRLGPHSGIISLTTSGFLLYFTGFPSQAAGRMERALRDAEELGHAYSKAYALFHVAYFRFMNQDIGGLVPPASELLALANRYDYQIWRALAMILLAVATAFTEDADEGLAEVEQGIAIYQTLETPPVFWALLLQVRAVLAMNAGAMDRALEWIDEGLAAIGRGTESMRAGLLITKGDILMAHGETEGARQVLELTVSEALKRSVVLPALAGLVRLARIDPTPHTVNRLREVYDGFTEGFDHPDLVAASQILESHG